MMTPLSSINKVSKSRDLFISQPELIERFDVRRTRLPSIRPLHDYDPMEHRDPANPIRPWMAYLNLIRTLFGPGLLIMPLAISQAGMILGPILTVCIGCLTVHTHLLLLKSLNEVSRQLKVPYISYRYGFRLAILHGPPLFHFLGNYGPEIIAVFMFMTQLGLCTVFVIITADSLQDVADWQNRGTAFAALLVPMFFMQLFMKNLFVVTYVSFVGTFLSILGLVIIMILLFVSPDKDVELVENELTNYFWFVGACLFNLSIVGVLLSLDKAVKEASIMVTRFGVVRIGIYVPLVISIIFGSIAYWSFGTMEENILRSLALDENIVVLVVFMYLTSTVMTYPIQCYPAIAVIIEVIKYHDPYALPNEKTIKLVKTVGRPVFVLVTFLIAYYVPFQGPFVAFVGNLCTSMLGLVFPALMDTCIRYPDQYGRYAKHLIKNIVIICLGIVDWIFGVYYCGYIIYINILSSYSPSQY